MAAPCRRISKFGISLFTTKCSSRSIQSNVFRYFINNSLNLNAVRVRSGIFPCIVRSFSNATFSETDFTDLKHFLSKNLKKKEVNDATIATNLKILEVIYQHHLDNVDATIVQQHAEKLAPSELYQLASHLFILREKVGEEAVCLAAPLFRLAADAGDVNGKYSYAQLLRLGQGGLDADPLRAVSIFDELAKKGHPHAQFALAGMYYAGVGVKQNYETAYTLYQVAVENGVYQGDNFLGKMYLEGQGVKVNNNKAFEHFKQGADNGDLDACVSTAYCYSHGKGTTRDYEHAFDYHSRAAEKGHPVALYNIGTQYFAGKGVEHSMVKAAEAFQKAADLGFNLAQVNLGNMYYHGIGVIKDWEKARQLYSKAAPGNHNARLLLEELESEMQIEE